MESPLPFIDDHVLEIEAPPEAIWSALVRTLGGSSRIKLPSPIVSLWGLNETSASGPWRESVNVGDTLVGFRVGDARPAQLLSLRGSHHFSSYELRFELEPLPSGRVAVHAKTFAAFSGVLGLIYRALVIGTGGHRFVVRRMLRAVRRRARQAMAIHVAVAARG